MKNVRNKLSVETFLRGKYCFFCSVEEHPSPLTTEWMLSICQEYLLDDASETLYMGEQPVCASWERVVYDINSWKCDSCEYAKKELLGALTVFLVKTLERIKSCDLIFCLNVLWITILRTLTSGSKTHGSSRPVDLDPSSLLKC